MAIRPRSSLAAWLSWAAIALTCGCATQEKWIQHRPADESWASQLIWSSDDDSELSPATLALLGSGDEAPQDREERARLLISLGSRAARESDPRIRFALSELTALEAERIAESLPAEAIGYYTESVVHAYHALAVDPRHRVPGTTQRYNDSLAGLLRLLQQQDQVRPGAVIPLPITHAACSISIDLKSARWTEADFHSFEFASDYQVLGLRNHYHTTGVGTPLIGIRYHPDHDHPEDKYYPTKLCYPLTAFARAETYESTAAAPEGGVRLVLELHDAMEHATLNLAGRETPLETDITTPLAYFLDQPELHEEDVSTLGFINPAEIKQRQGVYLLEPYDPNRIPVLMVHGLWSSPATWMEMFNDLRSDPEIRSRYQFWFYLYPTGNPFWVSAAQLRSDLAILRRSLDPNRTARALDQSILVGHSMGGLLSRLQTVDSGQDFWQIVSHRRFNELDADDEVRRYLANLFFFQPNPSIQRVVTIGTPHRGSRFANGFTQWLGAKIIAAPMQTLAARQELFQRNPDFFRPRIATRLMTSIDSLSPDSPMLAALLAAQPGPWIRYHNVVGDKPRSALTSWYRSRGDGVVSVKSSRLDDLPQLASQISVPEDHVAVHRHPQAVAEVRRVLLEHVASLQPIPYAATPAASEPTVRLASHAKPMNGQQAPAPTVAP